MREEISVLKVQALAEACLRTDAFSNARRHVMLVQLLGDQNKVGSMFTEPYNFQHEV